jgi:hypothetical protein
MLPLPKSSVEPFDNKWFWLAALDDFRNWVGLGLEAREKK